MPSLRQPANFYAGNQFDRLAARRTDTAWLQEVIERQAAWIVPLWNGRSLVAGGSSTPRIGLVAQTMLDRPVDLQQLVLLGEFAGQLVFGMALSGDTPPLPAELGEFHDLRVVGGLMDRHEAGLLGYARALLMWQERHRFCGRCGSTTQAINAGHVLKCSNTLCGISHFPRLDPAIIVLITDGERVLLGRQAQWPTGRYSTIAGFIEWAESIEEAVAREVHEETGVHIDAVEYHSSQPWPFPSSLMLGFIAHACTTDIERRDQELEDARWFTRDDIARGRIILPPPQALSYRLIESWYDRASVTPLASEVAAQRSAFTQPART